MGIDDVLWAITSSTGRPSRLALASSRNLMRAVATRPGTTTLEVTLSAATSEARVLDQASSEARSAFETLRLGSGAIAPDEELVTTRPQRCLRILRRTRLVIAMVEATMD